MYINMVKPKVHTVLKDLQTHRNQKAMTKSSTHLLERALEFRRQARLFLLLALFSALTISGYAQSSVSLAAGTHPWAGISWTGGTPTAGTNIVINFTGAVVITGVPATAFGSLTTSPQTNSSTLSMALDAGTSFTTYAYSAATARTGTSVTFTGAPLDLTAGTVTFSHTTTSTLNLGGNGFEQATNVSVSANHTISGFPTSGVNPALTLTGVSAARTTTLSFSGATEFASLTTAGSVASSVTINGGNLNVPTITVSATGASTINFNGNAYVGDLKVNINSAANHFISGLVGSSVGKLTVDNLTAVARSCTLTITNAATRIQELIMRSTGGGVLTVLPATNPLRSTATSTALRGTGILNQGGIGPLPSGNTFDIDMEGGGMTVNGFNSTQTGLVFNAQADGSPRTLTISNPSSGSHASLNLLDANVTYAPSGGTTWTGTISGPGSVNQSGIVLTLTNTGAVNPVVNVTGSWSHAGGSLSITGNANIGTLNSTGAGNLSVTGNLSVSGTHTHSNTGTITVTGNYSVATLAKTSSGSITLGGDFNASTAFTSTTASNLICNGGSPQALSWASGTPQLGTMSFTQVTTISGSVRSNNTITLPASANVTFTSGTFFTNFGSTLAYSSSGTGKLIFNNWTLEDVGGNQNVQISCNIDVNGLFTGVSNSNYALSFPYGSGVSRTLTFKGDANFVGSVFNPGAFTTVADLYHTIIFEGSSVNLGTRNAFSRTTGTAPATANFHGIDVQFKAPAGGQSIAGSAGTCSVRNFTINGTGPITNGYTGIFDVYGNLTNNATSSFTTTQGNGATQTTDRFNFRATGAATLGSTGGAYLSLNQMTVVAGCNLTLLQDLTLAKASGGGSDGVNNRAFGIQSSASFNVNGFELTFDCNCSNPTMMFLTSPAGGTWSNSTSGTIYFKSANSAASRLYFNGNESIYNLRVAGTNGLNISMGTSSSSVFTIKGTTTLESNLNYARGSQPDFLEFDHQSKIIRNTGTLTSSTANTILFPGAGEYYDLVYNGGSTVAAGLEWNNADRVRHLTIGPESGASNATGVTLASLGSRSISGNLYLNSTATSALNISAGGGLPMVTAGSTVYRYNTGTVTQAPVYPTTINLFYGGEFTSGAELPAGAQINRLNNLSVDAGSGKTVTMAGQANVAADLTIVSGNLDLTNFTADRQSSGGTISIAAGSTLFIGGSNTFPANYSSIVINPASTVDYNGTTQTVSNQAYGNLTVSGIRTTNTVTFTAGTTSVVGAFLPSATFAGGGYLVDPAHEFSFLGASGQSIPEFNYQNLTANNNNKTLVGTVGIGGAFTKGLGTYTTTGSTVNYYGTGNQTVEPLNYNNLIISGSRGSNNVTLSSVGTIEIAGTVSLTATFSSGGYIVAGSTVNYTGSAQSVVAIPVVGYNNLSINQSSGNATASGNIAVAGSFTLGSGKLILNGTTMTIGSSGSISVTSPSGSKMIDFATGGQLVKQFSSPSSVSFTWPIGTGSSYTPASVANFSATGTGSVTIEVYNNNSPSVADALVAMDRYWNVSVSGLTGITTDVSFAYVAGDVVGNEAAYVARRFSGGSWNNDGAIITSRVITATGLSSIAGEWTAGETGAFAAVTIFYSLGGPWTSATSWSNTGFGGAPAASSPSGTDVVQIGDNKTITVSSTAISSGSLQIQSTGILEFVDLPNASNSLGSVTGTGRMFFNNSTASTPSWPAGTYTTFISPTGGIVEFGGTGAYTIPNQATFNRLVISGSGAKQSSTNLTLNGTYETATGATFNATHNISLRSNVVSNGTTNQTAGTTSFDLGAAQSVSGSGNLNVNNLQIAAGSAITNTSNIGIYNNVTNLSNASTALQGSGTITFSGTGTTHTIGGSGTGALIFGNLTISGSNRVNTALTLSVYGDITNSSTGVSGVAFNQTAGDFIIGGGTSQTTSGSGTGTFLINNLLLDNPTTWVPTTSFTIAGNFTNNSSLSNALDATNGKLTFTSPTATIDGTGTGIIAFYNLELNGAARLTANRDIRLRGDLTNNSTGQSGISMVVSNVDFGIGGTAPQTIGGTGTGSLVFDDFTILAGSSLASTTSIEIKGDFNNLSNGLSGISFNQPTGTTTFSGTAIQTMSSSGSGAINFNNLVIANTPSRLNASTSFTVNGNFTNASDGITGVALSVTTGTTTFGNTSTAQMMSATGSGTVSFNNFTITAGARVNSTANIQIAGTLSVNGSGQGFPAIAFNNTGNTVVFNGSSAQTVSGTGSGLLQFATIQVSGSPSRVNFTRDWSISTSINNSSNGLGSPLTSISNSGCTVTFNGTSLATITGSGTGALIFNHLTIASGAAVQTNQSIQMTGDYTNNSNGISGNSWSTSAGSRITFNGSTTQTIGGTGTGNILVNGITVASGTRVNSTKDIINNTSSLQFNGSGIGGYVYQQTAGTLRYNLGGGGQNIEGTGSGIVEFYNFELASGAPGTAGVNRNFTVTNNLIINGSANGTFSMSQTVNITINTNNLVFTGSASRLTLTPGTPSGANRNHVLNVSGDVIINGTSRLWTFNSNGGFYGLITVNLTGTNKTISGTGTNYIRLGAVNISGSYTNNFTGDSLYLGTDNTFVPDVFTGTGTWTQGTNGKVALNYADAEWTLPAGNFIASATGNTVRFEATTAGTRSLHTADFHHLILSHTGTTAEYIPTGNMTVNGNLNMLAGNLTMGNNNLYIGGTTTWTGTLSVGNNTVEFGHSGAQSVPALSYFSLIKSGTGTASLVGTTTIRNSLALTNGTLSLASQTLNLGTTGNVAITRGDGQLSGTPTFTPGVSFNYTYQTATNANVTIGNEMLPGSNTTDLNDLTINHTGSSNNRVITDRNLVVNGILALTAGRLDVSGFELGLPGTSVSRSSGTLTTSAGSTLTFRPNVSDITLPDGLFTNNPASIGTLNQNRLGTVTLGNQDLAVSGSVTFGAAGHINTNTSKIDLGTTGQLVNESNAGYVKGRIQATRDITLPAATINFGNMGVRMRNYSQNVGAGIVVLREAGVASAISTGNGPLSANQSVRTRWSVSNVTTQPSNGIELELSWFADNDNTSGCGSCSVNRMAIYTRPDNTAPWTRLRLGDVWSDAFVDASTRRLYTRATHFSDFAPAYEGAPLPVTFNKVAAVKAKSGVEVTWSTLTEKNTSHFVIERSADGVAFEAAGQIPASGNSNSLKSYGYFDQVGQVGNYYRIRSVDFDGTTDYSDRVIVLSSGLARAFDISPNPTKGQLKINLSGFDQAAMLSISIMSADGKAVLETKATLSEVNQVISDVVPGLPQGVYTIKIADDAGVAFKKFVKE